MRIERHGDKWVLVTAVAGMEVSYPDRSTARAALVAAARASYAIAAPPAPADAQPLADGDVGPTRPFETLMVVEGRWTGDDRLIMVDGLSWDGLLPMPLTLDHGEGCESVVGRIDEMERRPGGGPDERYIVGRGVLDLADESGQEAEHKIDGKFLRGVSVDIDAIERGGVDPATVDPNEEGWQTVVETARVRALALCPIPAFAEAYITLGTLDTKTTVPAIDGPTPIPADQVPEVEEPDGDIIIIAAGHTITVPDVPPAEWFAEPVDVEIAGALTVTDEGRVYGLLAPRGVAHIGRADGLTAPLGNVDYGRFVRGETIVDGGTRVATGNLTMNCGHGTPTLAAGPTIEHYDNTCSVAATVAVGECSEGVWVAGALLPDVDGESVRRMMACQLSGHWVPNDRNGYDLVAALLVPVPGYPYARQRPSVTLRDGALAASAIPVVLESGALTADGGCGCDDEADRLGALEARVAALEPTPPAPLAALGDPRYATLAAAHGRVLADQADARRRALVALVPERFRSA